MIPFKKINLGRAWQKCRPLFEGGNIGWGNVTQRFEKELAEYVGAKYCIAVNSCTSALMMSLLYERMRTKIYKVSIPSMTMALVPNAILHAGLDFSFNRDTDWVGGRYQLLGSKTVDSAQQLRKDDYKGLDSKIKLCYSFYPTKPIGSIDGGAIVTNDKDFYEWAYSYAFYGRKKRLDESRNSWEYEIEGFGGKFNYNDVQSMICLEQLHRLDQTNKMRHKIKKLYDDAFKKMPDTFVKQDSDYLYRINVEKRDEFIEYMKKNGVECGVHFKPLHMMKPFGRFIMERPDVTCVEKVYAKTVSLPFYDLLINSDVQRIINLVITWRESFKN